MLTLTLAAAMWQYAALGQDQDAIGGRSAHLITIFIGIAAFALLAQALAMIAMAVGAMRAQKQLAAHVEALRDKVEPLIKKTDYLVSDLGPQFKAIAAKVEAISVKVEATSANVEIISGQVREKLIELGPSITAANRTFNEANETVRDVNFKARQQVVRINGMVGSVLDATAQMGRAIQHSLDVPVREAGALVDGVRVALNTFIRSTGRRNPPVYRAPIGTYTPSRPESYPGDRPDLEP